MTKQKKTRRQLLEEFLSKQPNDAFSRYGLALECMNSGDTAAADSHFRELLERNSGYVPAYLMYGQLLARESRTDEARAVLIQGIGQSRQFPRPLRNGITPFGAFSSLAVCRWSTLCYHFPRVPCGQNVFRSSP